MLRSPPQPLTRVRPPDGAAEPTRLSREAGMHSAAVSADGASVLHTWSSETVPPRTLLCSLLQDADGHWSLRERAVVYDAARDSDAIAKYNSSLHVRRRRPHAPVRTVCSRAAPPGRRRGSSRWRRRTARRRCTGWC